MRNLLKILKMKKCSIYKIIEEELTTHIETKHKEITDTFDPADSGFEDWINEEFFQFFCPEKSLISDKGPLHQVLFSQNLCRSTEIICTCCIYISVYWKYIDR